MSGDLWRWADPAGKQRRVKLDELRAAFAEGAISANTPVWKPGWRAWRSASEVPELKGAPVSLTPPPADSKGVSIPPPPLAMLAVQYDFEAEADRASSPPVSEPPPPPAYVPLPTKGGTVPTVIGGSGVSVTAPGKSVPPPIARDSTIPTQIGLPPPQEMKALVDARRAGGDGVEELSGSVLLDELGSVRSPEDDLDAGLPKHGIGNLVEQLKADIAEILAKRPPRNKGLVVVAGVLALSLVITVFAIFLSIVSAIFGSSGSDKGTKTAASASSSATSAPVAAFTTAAPKNEIPAPAPAPNVPKAAVVATSGDCSITADAKLVSPRAVISGGLEVAATSTGLAVGFATTTRDGAAQWFGSTTVAHVRGAGDIRRVTPMVLGGKPVAISDVDRRGDRLAQRRVVGNGSLIDVGIADNAVMWAPHGTSSVAKLFDLEGEGPVEALRAVPLSGQKGVAVAFRRGNAIYLGVATGEAVLEAKGALSRVAGLGQVGSPAIATSGDAVMAAWADRAGEGEWQVRFVRTAIGEAPGWSTAFTPPEGGLGVAAMSPSLASLSGGRFLLAWTEGPVASHQVRAITFGSDGSPSRTALAVSGTGVNAGQPQAAVAADGKGLVAFLAAKGRQYEVHAATIACK